MDVWLNNHFPCKDLEYKWTNHLYRVVSGPGSFLFCLKKILFGPKAQVVSHDFCSHPIAIGPWTKAVLSRKLRWSWNQISGGIGKFETVNHEATVTNYKHISSSSQETYFKKSKVACFLKASKNLHSKQWKLCNFKIWFRENEKGRNLTPAPDHIGQTDLPCTIDWSMMYHPDNERTEDIPVSWNHSWFRIVMWCHNCKSSNNLFFGRSFVARYAEYC